MKILDGSKGEGGGQILRNAVCYAALLQQNLRLHSIRAGRRKPGLRPQHLAGLRLAADICGGTLIGDYVGSDTFEYHPPHPVGNDNTMKNGQQEIEDQTYEIEQKCPPSKSDSASGNGAISNRIKGKRVIVADIGTAGSICLLLQVGFPCMLGLMTNGDLFLELRGGTNADLAPQIDYMEYVFLPTIWKHCFDKLPKGKKEADARMIGSENENMTNLCIERRGYYPRGGGIVKFSLRLHASEGSKMEADPTIQQGPPFLALPLRPITLVNRGRVTSISIKAFHAGKVPRKVAQILADAALGLIHPEQTLSSTSTSLPISPLLPSELQTITPTVEIVRHDPAIGSASGIILVATTSEGCILGGSSIGRKGEDAVVTGRKAAKELLDTLREGGCVDDWLQDQLILFAALANGESNILTGSLTLHTQSAIRVAEEMTGATFKITRVEDACITKVYGYRSENKLEVGVDDHTRMKLEKKDKMIESTYGMSDYVHGKHIITCNGIGFKPSK